MQEATGARIKVENRMDHVKERVVRISSTDAENVYKAFKQVLDKISGDPELRVNMHVNYMQQPTTRSGSRYQQIDPGAIRQYFQRLLTSPPGTSAKSSYNGVSVRPVGTRQFSRSVLSSGASDPRSNITPFQGDYASKKRKINEATAH